MILCLHTIKLETYAIYNISIVISRDTHVHMWELTSRLSDIFSNKAQLISNCFVTVARTKILRSQ